MKEDIIDNCMPVLVSSEPDEKGVRTFIEYKLDEDGKKVKIVRRILMKTITTRVHGSIAKRMKWVKFGEASRNSPGPDPSTTSLCEEVILKLHRGGISATTLSTEAMEKQDLMNQLKDKKTIGCRICKGDHWTSKCPYKDTLQPLADMTLKRKETIETPVSIKAAEPNKPDKYVPPSLRSRMRETDSATGLSSMIREEVPAVRVTNLSEYITEAELRDLFLNAGHVYKVLLPKEKTTGRPKGYAFIHFTTHEAATNAIRMFHGYGYENLILRVEWVK
jgi:translation initiation factor 3 subunit G